MDIPLALDGVLRSLSSNFDVSSWKVCAEKNKEPTVVIRYTCKPLPESDMLPNELCTATYTRKSLSRTIRDQKRMSEFKERRTQTPFISDADIHVADRQRKMSPCESKCDDTENVNKVNVDVSDSDSLRRGEVNEKREVNKHTVAASCSLVRPPPPPPLPATPRAAHDDDTEMDTCTASYGQADGCLGGEENGESSDSDTASVTEREPATSELDREFNRNLLKHKLDSVRDKTQYLGKLKRKRRNKSFNKIVLDQRRGLRQKLICRSDDVLLTCDTDTQAITFYFLGDGTWHTDDLAGCVSAWSDIDRGGTYGQMIERLDVALEDCMSLVREMI